MTRLSLGVVELPYVDAEQPRRKKYKAKVVSLSTGDVAEILEAKYGVMQHFFDTYQGRIATAMAEAVKDRIEALIMGRPATGELFPEIGDDIKVMFHKFISEKEIERLGITGVPTQAALSGVSHRFKHPYAKRGSRPSFIDTGLYLDSFVAEVSE